MLINPQRAQANLDDALAKVRSMVRMRLGLVAGALIVGLFQINFGNGRPVLEALMPILGLGVMGVAVILLLAQRDKKKAQDIFESQTFRVPKRKSRP